MSNHDEFKLFGARTNELEMAMARMKQQFTPHLFQQLCHRKGFLDEMLGVFDW